MDPIAQSVADRYKKAKQPLPAIYLPSQTTMGYSVFVPNPKDAQDLTRFLDRSRLGRARTRIQKSYQLAAVELIWTPSNGPMPSFKDFSRAVEQWGRRHGYRLARDMRELRQGLEGLQK